MLAMQYVFPLADDFDMGQIRQRVADKGPLFDDYPGLVQKAFLCSDVAGQSPGEILGERIGNEYATFYLWESVEAARNFVLGDAFKAVCATFGRPRIQSWQVLAQHSRDGSTPRFAVQESETLNGVADLGLIALAERQAVAPAFQNPGLHSYVVALDPYRWELVRFTLWREAHDAAAARIGNSRSYEVLHLAAPGGTPGSAAVETTAGPHSLPDPDQVRLAFS